MKNKSAKRNSSMAKVGALMALLSLVAAPLTRAATATWTGAGPDQLWSDAANWSGTTPSGNAVLFPPGAFPVTTNTLGAVNNIVSANLTCTNLTFSNATTTASSDYITTFIDPYVTLAVNGPLVVNGATGGTEYYDYVTMAGTNCTFIVSNLASTCYIGGASVANVELATLTLADGTNIIITGTLDMGYSAGGNGRLTTVNLGNGTNVINANIIQMGLSKAQCTVQFAGPNGGVTIAGTNGARVTQLVLGYGSSGSGSANGQLLLAGHPASVLVYTNILGEDSSDTGTASYGAVTIDNGTYDVTSLFMGVIGSAGTGDTAGNAFTVGGNPATTATLIVNSPSGPGGGNFIISDSSSSSKTSSGTLNINTNGTVELYGNITKIQATENTGTINLNGGTLILESLANTIGSAAIPIDNLNLNGGTLQLNVNGANVATANITASSVSGATTYGPNIINIGSVTNVIIPVNIHLITYVNGSDPGLGNFQLGAVPAGYTATLQDNVNGDNSIDLNISANVQIIPLLWAGAVGSTPNNNWNFTAADWRNLTNGNSSVYANPDLVYFDDSASNATVTLATNFTPGGLTFSNSVLNYTLNGTGSMGGAVGLVMDGSAMVTLADSGGDSFNGGVAVNSGTVLLDDANSTIAGLVSIATGATLQIGNNDAKGNLPTGLMTLNGALILDQTSSSTEPAAIAGSGSLTLNGNGTVTLSSSANTFSGNVTVNAGDLALTGSGTISNSQAVVISGATFDVSGISGITLLNSLSLANAKIVVNPTNAPYLQPPINVVNGALTLSGAGNIINVVGLPAMAVYPSVLTLIQAPSISGFNMTLGTLPAGYSGYVTATATAVQLVLTNGPVGTRPYVTWSGMDALNNVSTNWSDAMNWLLAGVPLSADTVVFDTADQQGSSALSSPGGGPTAFSIASANNFVDTNFTVATLIYTNIGNSGTPSYQNTYIANGATLTITNSLAFGSTATDFGDAAQEFVTVSGTNGTLDIINSNSTLVVALASATGSGEQAMLDMSALGTFNATVSVFEVGAIASTADYLSGIAYLAATNTITAVGGSGGANEAGQDEALSFLVGETGKSASLESYLYLGQQNLIRAYTIGVGIAKEPAEMQFNPIWSNPMATIIGGDGVSPVQVLAIGDGLAQTGGSTTPIGTVDFTGGTVNAAVSTMYIGRTPNASGPHPATGTLTFEAGTVAVGTLYDGFQAFNTTDNGVGTVNVNASVNGVGVLKVGTLNLAWTTGSSGASPTTGALNINGGTVLAGTIAADTNNSGQSAITLSGGTLVVTNAIGSSAAPLYSLSLQGTLQLNPNVSSTNIVATSVTISGATTLNIASVVTTVGGPLQIPIISYLNGSDPTTANLVLGTLPFGYSNASLVDDGVSHIYLQITAPAALVWAGALAGGALDGNWNTTDQNWLNGAVYSAYADPELVSFNDTAQDGSVTLAATVSPGSLTVNNSVLNYTFSGSHAISGAAGLVKSGTASLTLAETGGDNFSGGITVSGGSLLLDNAGSSIGGNTTLAGGSMQLGNNDANGNLPGAVADNGSLILDRSDNLTLANVISGAGSVIQAGTNTVTLAAANSAFTGTVMVTNGILKVAANTGLGAATATTVVTNSGAFDVNDIAFNAVAAPALIISGPGFNGAGAIINNGAAQESAFSNVTVAANVTIGGANRWDIRASSGSAAALNMSPPGTPYSITKVGTNEIALVSVGIIDTNLGLSRDTAGQSNRLSHPGPESRRSEPAVRRLGSETAADDQGRDRSVERRFGPVQPEIYTYVFQVDGVRTLDMANPNLKNGRALDASVVEIPGSPARFDEVRDVPHGAIHIRAYTSTPLKRQRTMYVYVPPGYDTATARRFPVLYLRHGSGDTEANWSLDGRAGVILDNLLAQRKAVPMLIVMTNGDTDGTWGGGSGPEGIEMLGKELLGDVIPFVEKNYGVAADRDHRAIAGL